MAETAIPTASVASRRRLAAISGAACEGVTSLSAGRSCRRSRRRRRRRRASRPRSRRRGGGPGSPPSGTSRPTSARCASSGVVSAASVAGQVRARRDQGRDARPPVPPRSRSCTGSSGRRSRSRARSAARWAGRRDRWRRRVSAARHRRREYRTGARRAARSAVTRPPGSPSLRGSVAAGERTRRAPPVRRRRARSRARGRGRGRTARPRSPGGRAPRAPRAIPGAWRGSRRTSTGGSKCAAGSTNQRGRRHGGPQVDARRRRAPTRAGRGSAAGRRRPPPRRRPTASATPSRNSIPGSSVWSVRLPGSRTFGWSGSRLK